MQQKMTHVLSEKTTFFVKGLVRHFRDTYTPGMKIRFWCVTTKLSNFFPEKFRQEFARK